MKFLGFLLLTAGWGIVLSAVILLRSSTIRGFFVCAALSVEAIGLALVTRSHLSVEPSDSPKEQK